MLRDGKRALDYLEKARVVVITDQAAEQQDGRGNGTTCLNRERVQIRAFVSKLADGDFGTLRRHCVGNSGRYQVFG